MDQASNTSVNPQAAADEVQNESGMTRRQVVGFGLLGLTGAAAFGTACYRAFMAARAAQAENSGVPAPGPTGSLSPAPVAAAPAGKPASVFKG
ncbi:MAG: hypothetical protein ABSE73_25385, partial [Planctomycetota bacterium]